MAKESSDLTFVHVEREVIHCFGSTIFILSVWDQLGEERLVVDLCEVAD